MGSSQHLGIVSFCQLKKQCQKLGLKYKGSGTHWDKADEEQFADDWLNLSKTKDMLVRKYKRSYGSLIVKAKQMKLGRRPLDEYYNADQIADAFHISRDVVYSWMKKGLKTIRPSVNRILIDGEDLMRFLEKNKDLYDASRIDFSFLPMHPEWMRRKFFEDNEKPKMNINRPYTNAEDLLIQKLVREGKDDEYIARTLGRTETGIRVHRQRICIYRRETK